MEIIITNNEDEIKEVSNELDKFNESIVGKDNHQKLNLILKNENGKIIAGLLGGSYWGWLYVDRLWVNEKYRKSGIGKMLLKYAENEGIKRGCEYCHLDTMSWQALGFYEKQGYINKCEIKNMPKGYSKIHLIKKLK